MRGSEVQMNDSKTVKIKLIGKDGYKEVSDEVAVEKEFTILSETGSEDSSENIITCSPSYYEEMMIGRKVTMAPEGETADKDQKADALTQISAKQLLDIAKMSIESPGELFQRTGAVHSCVLARGEEVLCHIEDIKRHNALDKAIGYAIKNDISLASVIVISSGRISFDYLQKVVKAGIGAVASRAAVTDAAIELAREKDITLLGFVREGRANLYYEGRVKINT